MTHHGFRLGDILSWDGAQQLAQIAMRYTGLYYDHPYVAIIEYFGGDWCLASLPDGTCQIVSAQPWFSPVMHGLREAALYETV
jgi:hypothetical protein